MLGMPAISSVLPLRRAQTVALGVAMLASIIVPVSSASPAQAYIGPSNGGSGVTAPSVAAAKSLAATKATKAGKTSLGSAVTATKPVRAKKPAKKGLSSSKILTTARKYDGRFYRRAGTTPAGFDCSGYTRYVFAKLGKSLPHNSSAQYSVVKHVSRANARAGDLIFFRSSSGRIYHVGIYAGGGKLYHASQRGVPTGLGTIFSSNVSFGRV